MRVRDVRLDMFKQRGGASCVQVARKLQQYLDGELDSAGRDKVAAHLAECRRCGLDEAAYREIKAALERRRTEVPPEPMNRLRQFAMDVANGNIQPDPDEASTMTTTAPAPEESPRDRWRRRAVTIPTMLVATSVGIASAPLVVPLAVAGDVIRRRPRLPMLRAYGFLAQYLFNDSAEILLAGPLWVWARLGTKLDTEPSRRRHERLQAWSIRILAKRAEQLLGISVVCDSDSEAALGPGPAIVLCRHVNVFDASLPSLLYQRIGCHTRGVIMAELLADPGFDLLYQQTGSVFIARDGTDTALQNIRSVDVGLDERTVAVIFPEGRLFRPDALERAMVRLLERSPERAARLSSLCHLLPPRPAGFLGLREAAPSADVVVVNHVGFDNVPALADLARGAPLDVEIQVGIQRFAREDIPSCADERIEWLDARWVEMDQWVEERLTAPT